MIYDHEYLEDDWAKAQQVISLGVEQMAKPPRRSSYIHEPTGRESTMEELESIQRGNVEASNERINYHE